MKFSSYTIFFLLACLGFLTSLIVHILLLQGISVSNGFLVLHAGVFVVVIALIIRAKKENPGIGRVPITVAFKHAPLWLKIFAIVCWLYSFVNFFYHNPGSNSRQLTDQEGMLLFSGVWIAFYAAGVAGLYPEKRAGELQ